MSEAAEPTRRARRHPIEASTWRGENGAWPEVSTAQVRTLLAQGSALVLDARPQLEWAISHLPDAITVGPKPGVSMGDYVGDVRVIARLAHGDWSVPLLIYCNGPYCRKTTRLAAELQDAGFTDIRCYHLGAPVWRALGGLMVTEKEGALYIFQRDRSACWVDASRRIGAASAQVSGAVRLSAGSVNAAKNDGRLPMQDHNTRVVVFGDSVDEARSVAQELVSHAFHNVTYFNGPARLLATVLQAAGAGRHRDQAHGHPAEPGGSRFRQRFGGRSAASLFALGVLAVLPPASAHRACLSTASATMPESPAPTVSAWSLPQASVDPHDHAARPPTLSRQLSLPLRARSGTHTLFLLPGFQPLFQHSSWGGSAQGLGQGAGVSHLLNRVDHIREEDSHPGRPAVLTTADALALDHTGVKHVRSIP